MMIREQDQTLSMIGGTLTTLAQQAGLMGTEIGEHNECVFAYRLFHSPTDPIRLELSSVMMTMVIRHG